MTAELFKTHTIIAMRPYFFTHKKKYSEIKQQAWLNCLKDPSERLQYFPNKVKLP